jgi:hypothetical protein
MTCPKGKILNPATGRCILKYGKTALSAALNGGASGPCSNSKCKALSLILKMNACDSKCKHTRAGLLAAYKYAKNV